MLLLLSVVLGIMILNGIQRVKEAHQKIDNNQNIHCIDLYVASMSNIPPNATPGMTFLIDLGIYDLTTGVYMIRDNNEKPFKIRVPEVGEIYKITKGQYAGYVHTIKSQFLEVRGPSQIQYIKDNDTLKEDTKKIFLEESISKLITLHIPKGTLSSYRKLSIVNLSTYPLNLVTVQQTKTIPSNFIGVIYLSEQDTKIFYPQ